jgi:hypothetical protein
MPSINATNFPQYWSQLEHLSLICLAQKMGIREETMRATTYSLKYCQYRQLIHSGKLDPKLTLLFQVSLGLI